jgi:selenocysteine lyase/cysteine desulfurase
VLYLAPSCEPRELVAGGTGMGASEYPYQPQERPDRYEAGTPNTPGILGLGAAARLLAENGERMRADERELTRLLHEGLLGLPGFRVLGPEPDLPRVPIVAVVHDTIEADRLAFALDRRYGIAVRAGLHCAPWSHRTTGTLETGALRFGVGYGSTRADVELALSALSELSAELA